MPLAVSFTAACVRGLGLGNGEAPRAPTSVSVTAGVITITATYTIAVSTFPLARVEYRIARGGDAGQYTGSLPGASGSNSSGTISTRVTTAGVTENLVPNTAYTIFFRAVDASGQIGPETAGTAFTTGVEVAPTAAAPTLASTSVVIPFDPYIDITWAAGTAGTYPIATRQYSVVLGTGAAGTFTTVPGNTATGTHRVTTTAAGVPFLPSTPTTSRTYRVYMQYIASTTEPPTTATASADIIIAQEVLGNAPNVSLTTSGLNTEQQRTNFTLGRGNVPNNTTYNQKYQYAYGTSVNPTNFVDFPSSGTAFSVTLSGLVPNQFYYARVRPRSLGTDEPGGVTGNAYEQTRPLIPNAPTLSFSSTNASERGNAYLSWNATTYSTQYNVYRNGIFYANTSSTSMTVTGHSAGTAYYYQVLAGNRVSEFSSSSNTKYMTTGAQVDWSSTVSTAKYIQNYGSCPQGDSISSLIIQAPSSASSSSDAGYYYINTIKFEALKSSASSFGFSVGNGGTRPLYFHKTSGASPGGWGFGFHSIPLFSLSQTTGYYYEYGVYQGGADISSVFFKLTTTVQFGNQWGAFNSGCSPDIPNSIIGRNITLTGFTITSTTYA